MLEDLDKVDWASLHHKHDVSSTEIPDLIRRVAAGDETRREIWELPDALDDLFSSRGDEWPRHLYFLESTQYIIPFLIELLPTLKFGFQSKILHNFDELLQNNFGVAESRPSLLSPGWGYSFKRQESVLKACETIWVGYNSYIQYVNSSDEHVRRSAIHLLSHFTHQTSGIADLLLKRFEIEPINSVRVNIIKSLTILIVSTPGLQDHVIERTNYINKLFALFVKHDVYELKTEIAIAISQLAYTKMPFTTRKMVIDKEIIDWIKQCIRLNLTDKRFDDYKINFLIEAICLIDLYADDLTNITDILNDTNLDYEALHVCVRALLDAVFPRTDRSKIFTGFNLPKENKEQQLRFQYSKFQHKGNLSGLQKRALKLIIDNEHFWQFNTDMFSYFFDLPDNRNDLRQLIS